MAVAAVRATPPAAMALPPLALYVHLPWCVRKCPYCDFNSHAVRDRLPEDQYVAALLADLDQETELAQGRSLVSVFFGGGTPSLFSARAIARLLEGVAARLPLSPRAEITLEANPGAIEHDRFDGYRRAGVNRLSFGIQSFDDGSLQRIGRIHDSAEAVQAVRAAHAAGFDNVNIDLMYALPQQTAAMAVHDLERALELAPAHLSHYQLTIEPNTVFAARPPEGLPDEELTFAMQQQCQARLAAAGYAQYEVSAYARAGRKSVHNLNYWRFGDYLGIGAGAHGKLTRATDRSILRRWKLRHPDAYLRVAATVQRIGADETIAPRQLPFEYMLNALRLVEGFSLAGFEAYTGQPESAIAAPLARGIERGLLAREGGRIAATELGRRFLNDAIVLFMD
ncbi:MAG TPA: radical SAM family heme chaperone HemW [Xanthomonadaceae bacterium]|nr:radical SAM family heme chaperone HemW [Xanthomonadaceae bacterium]